MKGFAGLNLILIPFIYAIPVVILYYVIKLAVKNAIKESRE